MSGPAIRVLIGSAVVNPPEPKGRWIDVERVVISPKFNDLFTEYLRRNALNNELRKGLKQLEID